MNNCFFFRDFEIIKKGSKNTILKASDRKGCLFAIKIDKKPFLPLRTSYSSNDSSSSLQSLYSYTKKKYALLPPPCSSSFFPSYHILKGSLIKERKILMDIQGIKGVPILFWGGFDPEIERFVVVEELAGRDLAYYLNKYKKFNLSTTLKIAIQLFKILRGIHERGIIHRSLKPNNIALSLNEKNIMLLDFGLARQLARKKKSNKQRKSQTKFVGDLKFCGMNAHSFKNDTKVDDLISLGIIVIYFLEGSLNWENQDTSNFFRSVENIWMEKINFISKEIMTLYPLFYPYFKYLFSVKNDSINYDFLLNVIETWAKFEQIDLDSEKWKWSDENDKRESFDTDFGDEKNPMENFEEFEETTVNELMINYRVSNVKFLGNI